MRLHLIPTAENHITQIATNPKIKHNNSTYKNKLEKQLVLKTKQEKEKKKKTL